MKETGIIMSGNHPKLILDGIKTMTRRTYGLEKVNENPGDWEFKRLNNGAIALFWRANIMEEDIALCKCPYGLVGDRLWVRETWAKYPNAMRIAYKADMTAHIRTLVKDAFLPQPVTDVPKWKPSIFMPRWASRITLEITEVRVERLQDITEADALAEGIEVMQGTWQSIDPKTHKVIGEPQPYTACYHFEALWDNLNAKRGYGREVNPWVWVIGFKLVSR